MHLTRDELLSRLGGGGALVTAKGTLHMSFSDSPSYLTPLGRHLVGHLPAAGIGSTPTAEIARTTADLVTSVMCPALHGPDRGGLARVATRHPAVQINQTVTPQPTDK